ncbi:hypothetical protein MKEN_00021900 [Mycena kentingensis (nom. inval.)]|nr:hypothetical protein MKEN_00021900 [Mycena kentingensis (nom. inval.)]
MLPVPPQPPRTPVQQRVTRVPLAPNNNASRCHHIPVLGGKQDVSALNARMVHERLRQNHDRLQVKLFSPSPPAPAHCASFPIVNLFNSAFRSYTARATFDLHQLHAACVRAFVAMDKNCLERVRVAEAKQQVAEQQLRVLLERRKRSRSEMEEADAEIDGLDLHYPSATPTPSPPPRLMSPFVLAVSRSRDRTPEADDGTGFDLTISADRLGPPVKRRRVASPDRLLPALPDLYVRDTHPPYNPYADDVPGGRRSLPAPFCFPPCKPPLLAAPLARPTQRRPRIGVEHVDIMYWATQGKLVCRACVLTPTPSPSPDASRTRTPPPMPVHAFPTNASWDVLRAHCETMHPEACADVAALNGDALREVRRRLELQRRA